MISYRIVSHPIIGLHGLSSPSLTKKRQKKNRLRLGDVLHLLPQTAFAAVRLGELFYRGNVSSIHAAILALDIHGNLLASPMLDVHGHLPILAHTFFMKSKNKPFENPMKTSKC